MQAIIEGVRLDRLLKQQYAHLTQGLLEKSLRQGDVRVNGLKVKSAALRVLPSDIITLSPFLERILALEPKAIEPSPKRISLTPEDRRFIESLILWEDDTICVLNKPYGLAVQGGTNTNRHIDGLLRAYHPCYRLVHRLDRDTTGVFVVAKTPEMARHLTDAFKMGLVKKVYWALVEGIPNPPQGVIDAPLLKGEAGQKEKMLVDRAGKRAVTGYRLIKALYRDFSWVAFSPETGRTHQIRVHAAHMGHPLLGDHKYHPNNTHDTMQLHARSLSFRDPDGNLLTFSAPPPPHMLHFLERYRVNWEAYA